MKKLIFTAIAAFTVTFCFAQTEATDFTADDCEGSSHNLFTELNEGKVIVISWVMPCGTCYTPTYTSYNVVESYKTSNPDKVKMYICDDYANTACSSIKSWANPMTTDGATFFKNSAIKMSDYGTAGMPKVVILASDGSSNIVYFNKNSGVTSTNVQEAINLAIASNTTGIKKDIKSVSNLSIFPNPSVAGLTNISFLLNQTTDVNINIYNQLGELVYEEYSGQLLMGENTIKINTSVFNNGIYFVKINSSGKTSTQKLIITN